MNKCNLCSVEIAPGRRLCDACKIQKNRVAAKTYYREMTPDERHAVRVKKAKRAYEWLKSIGEI